jgi:hypothetical protein
MVAARPVHGRPAWLPAALPASPQTVSQRDLPAIGAIIHLRDCFFTFHTDNRSSDRSRSDLAFAT